MVIHYSQRFSITLNNPHGDMLMDAQNKTHRLLDDKMVNMAFITNFTGLTDKWFYKLISEGKFPEPIKLGRSSRWMQSEVEKWVQERIDQSRG